MSGPHDFLASMVERRRTDIADAFGSLSRLDLERLADRARPPRDLLGAVVAGPAMSVIAEVKKASPSAGAIAPDVDAAVQARRYQAGGASAVSVLCEPTSFGGSFDDLGDVAQSVDVPVLCKDFVVDEAQVFLARSRGADAVLLLAGVLGASLAGFVDLVRTLGMEPLVEVASLGELSGAREAGGRIVGVNARDLRTLEVDPAAAMPVVRAAADLGLATVLASGVRGRADVERAAAAGADAVLVGEALMRAADAVAAVEDLAGVGRRIR